jgi:hypothetical protein
MYENYFLPDFSLIGKIFQVEMTGNSQMAAKCSKYVQTGIIDVSLS